MIGLDTNVLVRYITQDDPQQCAAATRLVESHCSRETPGYICHIVLCELLWVLQRAYGYSKAQLIPLMEQVLVTTELEIEEESQVWQALVQWREGWQISVIT